MPHESDPIDGVNAAVCRCLRYESRLRAAQLNGWRHVAHELSAMGRTLTAQTSLAANPVVHVRWSEWAIGPDVVQFTALLQMVLEAAHACMAGAGAGRRPGLCARRSRHAW